MRQKAASSLTLQQCLSAITYSEMRFGATGPKASPRHVQLVDEFCARLDAILPWDRAA
ncbi:hypothetical protein IHV50_26890, partial [Escherichia coli]|nr:hypothetical protein [Escherichia coli]MCF6580842.1 hypothetical protein [Escherichia coli]